MIRAVAITLALCALASPALAAEKASAVPLKPQAVGAACQESIVCATGLCIEGVCADALTACKATAMKAPSKTCPKFSQLAFKPVAVTTPSCSAAALALKLPSAASATNACYKAGEGEICVVSTPKKAGAAPTYGVICNGLATADEAAVAGAKASTAPAAAPAAGNGAESASAAMAVATAAAGLLAAAVVAF